MTIKVCIGEEIISLGDNDWDVENEYAEVELDTQDIVNVFAIEKEHILMLFLLFYMQYI